MRWCSENEHYNLKGPNFHKSFSKHGQTLAQKIITDHKKILTVHKNKKRKNKRIKNNTNNHKAASDRKRQIRAN